MFVKPFMLGLLAAVLAPAIGIGLFVLLSVV